MAEVTAVGLISRTKGRGSPSENGVWRMRSLFPRGKTCSVGMMGEDLGSNRTVESAGEIKGEIVRYDEI
jgi:hypothetical protein